MKKIILSMLMMSGLAIATGKVVAPLVIVEEIVEENNFYVGIGMAALSARDSSVSMNFFDITSDQDRLADFTFHTGYWFTKYLALELRYTVGFHDDDMLQMDGGWSAFLKPTYRFDDAENRAYGDNYFSVYGLLGYGNVAFTGRNKLQGDIDNSDYQWGLGVSYTFRAISGSDDYPYSDKWTVFADYTSLGRDMDGIILDYPRNADLDALTLGIVYHF